ncbi:MAG: GNAT family N-acetyltransferase [Acidobacteriota bacterium]|nr:GNAT family N-acetyltransferase [Acidobacteriota bacterium]
MTQSGRQVEVRKSRASERQCLRDITLAAYQEYSRLLRPEYWASYEQHINATHDDLGAGEQLVALISDQPVGTAVYYPPGTSFGEDIDTAQMSPDCPEIRLLAVTPESRGSGAGRALMDAVVMRARDTGAPGLVLHTLEVMKAARALYASMGFERAPELDFQPAKEWFVQGYRLPL